MRYNFDCTGGWNTGGRRKAERGAAPLVAVMRSRCDIQQSWRRSEITAVCGLSRGIGRLSAVALPKLKADASCLYVTKGGARTWIHRFMLNGRA